MKWDTFKCVTCNRKYVIEQPEGDETEEPHCPCCGSEYFITVEEPEVLSNTEDRLTILEEKFRRMYTQLKVAREDLILLEEGITEEIGDIKSELAKPTMKKEHDYSISKCVLCWHTPGRFLHVCGTWFRCYCVVVEEKKLKGCNVSE